LDETIEKQGIGRDQLTIHSDRGSPMIAKCRPSRNSLTIPSRNSLIRRAVHV
jgi:hypothetical protein